MSNSEARKMLNAFDEISCKTVTWGDRDFNRSEESCTTLDNNPNIIDHKNAILNY